MYKKITFFLLFFSFCSLFQNEERGVVSVVDTDKGKEAIALGQELSEKKEIGYIDSQDLLFKEGLAALSSESSGDLSSDGAVGIAERTVYDNLVEDMRRSLRFYAKQTGQSFFLKIFLTGGGASTPGLTGFINEKLNIECAVFDPFENIEGNENLTISNSSQFTTALGLGIRGGMSNE